jgi:lysophospholipase L1-like esterase
MYGGAPATAHERLGKMMDKLIGAAPNALLVFTTIVPLPFQNGAYEDETMTFNSHVQALVKERADKGSHIIFLDQFAGFPENELGDQIHPNKAGYERMGAKFYGAIKSYLP